MLKKYNSNLPGSDTKTKIEFQNRKTLLINGELKNQ